MKQCPRCNQTYSDETLNFCLSDGELLTMQQPVPGGYIDDQPPTMILDQARVTDPIQSWQHPQGASPPAQWQQPQAPQQFGAYRYNAAVRPDQTMPTVAMILGIASLVLSCCYGGIWLGVPAAIVGFIGLRNVNNDPAKYGGRGLATAGIIMGGISLLITLIIIIAAIAGNIR